MSGKRKRTCSIEGHNDASYDGRPALLTLGVASAGSSSVPRHNYTTMEDPIRQIRLLKFCPGSAGTSISVEMSVCDLDEAPPYVAVSYTWGDTSTREILLNGLAMTVRYSAFYALWQVRRHYQGFHIWIDSLCINQTDIEEKGHQVARMYQIYEKAAKVAVCLGDHAHDSEWMMAVIRALGPIVYGLLKQYDYDSTFLRFSANATTGVPLWASIFTAMTESGWKRLLKALIMLAARPYWRRMWIVQELAAARHGVQLLCGAACIDLFLFIVTKGAMREAHSGYWQKMQHEHREDAGPYLSLVTKFVCRQTDDERSIFLDTNLAHSSAMLCADLRDRLFGTLGLINWERNGFEAIHPDYSKSAWELTIMMASFLDFNGLGNALLAFEIHAGHESMVAAIHNEQSRRKTIEIACEGNHTSERVLMKSLGVRSGGPSVYCTRLYRSSSGTLTAHLAAGRAFDENDRVLECWDSEQKIDETTVHCSPRTVYCDGEVAALLCPEAKEGDILVPVGSARSSLLLVVRRQTEQNNIYDIIGQGFTVRDHCIRPGPVDCLLKYDQAIRVDYLPAPGRRQFPTPEQWQDVATAADPRRHRTLCDCEASSHIIFVADVEITLTPSEAVILVGQDTPEQQGWDFTGSSYVPELRYRRLFTHPIAQPKGAITIRGESCYRSRIGVANQAGNFKFEDSDGDSEITYISSDDST